MFDKCLTRYFSIKKIRNLPDSIFLTYVVRTCSKTLFPTNRQIPGIHKIPEKFPTSGNLHSRSVFCHLRTIIENIFKSNNNVKTKYTSKKGRFNFSATLSRAPLVGIDRARPCNYNIEQ